MPILDTLQKNNFLAGERFDIPIDTKRQQLGVSTHPVDWPSSLIIIEIVFFTYNKNGDFP